MHAGVWIKCVCSISELIMDEIANENSSGAQEYSSSSVAEEYWRTEVSRFFDVDSPADAEAHEYSSSPGAHEYPHTEVSFFFDAESSSEGEPAAKSRKSEKQSMPSISEDAVPVYTDSCSSALDLKLVEEDGIEFALMDEDSGRNCTEILNHCKAMIAQIRNTYGSALCVFKVGITADPLRRFHFYKIENFDKMYLLHGSDSVHLTDMLESALIQSHNEIPGCRNIKLGGARNMKGGAPYFTYCVAARADGSLRIGA